MTQTETHATNATTDVIDVLDSFHCDNVVTAMCADAVINRLGGPAIFVLGDELVQRDAHKCRSRPGLGSA